LDEKVSGNQKGPIANFLKGPLSKATRTSRYRGGYDELSGNRHDFKAKLDKNYPRQGKPTQLSFDYAKEEEEDTGKGL
jgi:hypothetical protein